MVRGRSDVVRVVPRPRSPPLPMMLLSVFGRDEVERLRYDGVSAQYVE